MVFLVLFVGTVSNLEAVVSGLPRWFDYLMLVPWAMVGLTVIMLLLTPMVWARRYWSRRGGSTIRCWWSGGVCLVVVLLEFVGLAGVRRYLPGSGKLLWTG